MDREELVQKTHKLENAIMEAVVNSGLSYKQAMNAINHVRIVLVNKGSNLLDVASIQEVAKMDRFIRRSAEAGTAHTQHEDPQ